MRRLIAIKTIAFVCIQLCLSIISYGQAKSSFPYKLTTADIPPGFKVAGPFSKDIKTFTISANRGIVTDKKLIGNIYDKINVNTINEVYVTSYIPGKHSDAGLTVYIIQYKSKQMLDKEQLKLKREKGCRYLEKDNCLFIIWSEEYAFPKQVDAMAQHLKKRWNLTDISG